MDFKFLRHPIPLEYESLDHYLYRLGLENAIPTSWILKEFNLLSQSYPDNLHKVDSWTIENISKATGLSIQVIKNMTASGLSGLDNFNVWLKTGSRICPLCLRTQNYPRVYWQFSLLNICNTHNTILISKCPNCGTTITNTMIIKGVCKCGVVLESIIPTFINDQRLLDYNRKLYSAHNVGNSEKLFQDLPGTEYIQFLIELDRFFKMNSKYINQKCIDISQERFPELVTNDILCNILDDWPDTIYSIFDEIRLQGRKYYKGRSSLQYDYTDYLLYSLYNQSYHLNIIRFKFFYQTLSSYYTIRKSTEDSDYFRENLHNYPYLIKN